MFYYSLLVNFDSSKKTALYYELVSIQNDIEMMANYFGIQDN